ncbi:hypothetical protein [Nocardioides furvisabuli]
MVARPPLAEAPISGFRVGLLVLVLVTAAWRWWTGWHWSWFADDWFYLEQTQEMGFVEYVFQGYNSHLMPGQFLLTWALTAVAPLDYGWAALVLTFFAVASLLAWAAALREMFGERLRLLFPLAFLSLSPLLLLPSIWWASALQILPLQLCMGLCVLFVSRYLLRGRRRSDMIWLLVSYGAGLFFWQKALLVMIPLALVAWVMSPGQGRTRLVSTVRVLALPTAVSAAYTAVYLATRRVGELAIPRTEFGARTAADWQRFFTASAQDVGVPTLFGGPFQRLSDAWDLYDPAPPMLTAALTGLLLLLVVAALAIRRHSAPALACVLAYTTVNWGLLVTSARFLHQGTEGMGRYSADILPVAALVIALLTTRTVVEPPGGATRRPAPASGAVPRLGGAGLAILAIVVTVAMVGVNVTAWRTARESSPRPWVDAVVADSTRAGGAAVVNTLSPEHVLHPVIFMKYAELRRMLAPLDLPLRFDAPSDLLVMPDGTGRLKVAEVANLAAANVPPTNSRCGFLVDPGQRTEIPLTTDLYPWGWGVRMDYFADEATRATVTTDHEAVELSLDAGLNAVHFQVTDSVTSFEVTVDPDGGPVCVTRVFVGTFSATDASPWG